MDYIRQARDAFVAAEEAFSAGYEAYKNRELDLALARREGEGVAEAEERLKEQQGALFAPNGIYQQRREAALALCAALEVQPSVVRNALS